MTQSDRKERNINYFCLLIIIIIIIFFPLNCHILIICYFTFPLNSCLPVCMVLYMKSMAIQELYFKLNLKCFDYFLSIWKCIDLIRLDNIDVVIVIVIVVLAISIDFCHLFRNEERERFAWIDSLFIQFIFLSKNGKTNNNDHLDFISENEWIKCRYHLYSDMLE